MPFQEFRKRFPKTADYLQRNRDKLEQRRDSRQLVSSRGNWHGLVRYSSWDVIKSPKIVTQGIVRHSEFCIDDGGYAFIGKGVSAIVPTRVDIHYLTALLNSKLLEFYLRCICPIKQGGYYTCAISYLDQVPVRRIIDRPHHTKGTRERHTAERLYQRFLAEAHPACVLAHVEHQLAQKPEHGHVVHDLLAYLAEQMIAMNCEKQQEVTGFLKWLERKIGAAVDDLANKTRLRSYHEHDLDGLLEVLRQNHRKLEIDTDARAVQEAIDREFSKSLEKLTPLKAKIAATDRLIDQIVYRLYGLTPEEIAIVEGTSAGEVGEEDPTSIAAPPE